MIIFICATYLNCEKITTKEQICIFSTFFALTLTDPKVLNWQKQFFKYKKPTQEVLFVWMLLFWSAVKKIIDRVCRFWSSFCLEEATAQIHISTHPRGVFFRKKNTIFSACSPLFSLFSLPLQSNERGPQLEWDIKHLLKVLLCQRHLLLCERRC